MLWTGETVDLFFGPMEPDSKWLQRVDASRAASAQPGAAGAHSLACVGEWERERTSWRPSQKQLSLDLKEFQEGGKGKGFILSQPSNFPRDGLRCVESACPAGGSGWVGGSVARVMTMALSFRFPLEWKHLWIYRKRICTVVLVPTCFSESAE